MRLKSAYDFPPQFEDFLISDGVKLRYREWRPEETAPERGAVLIVHGYAEHSMRYSRWARSLADAGFRTGAFDFRGMGASEGARGFAESFDEYVADLEQALNRLQSGAPSGTPCFLYAHSMGGLIALLCLAKNAIPSLKGAIISGPLLGVSMPVPAWKTALGNLLIRVAPGFKLPLDLDRKHLTHDLGDLVCLESDELALSHVTPAWYFASLRAIQEAKLRVPQISVPTLWLLAGEERIVSADEIKSAFAALPESATRKMIELPGAYHELHNELPVNREKTFQAVIQWLNERIG